MRAVAIVGATGYAGGELARLLLRHPHVRIVSAVARSHQGQPLRSVQPQLHDAPDDLTISADIGEAEIVFTALPAGEAAKRAPAWIADGRTVIDIGSDFRLQRPELYREWYGYEHPAPELLPLAVYGLTERNRAALRGARLIANPGCYPTAALLALLPALAAGLTGEDVIVDAKSGVSGAGHTLDDAFLFGTVDESVRAYGLPKHRHTPEIEQEIARALHRATRLTFTPHLVPMTRGLMATCYADVRPGVTAAQMHDAYVAAYGEEPFVRIVDSPPATKATLGSNVCLVFATIDERTRRLVAIAALDNLVKGAAGSAIQNMNVALGYPEDAGLPTAALWP
ncbi:MAG: N-acetyl-gamma-glutamyl-phosphate reductase [Chloroflexi bacterium]|nr:MAG: N-acetyl-gamma-glutamyl-phosphate reductase [Chloroflexota bacterium]